MEQIKLRGHYLVEKDIASSTFYAYQLPQSIVLSNHIFTKNICCARVRKFPKTNVRAGGRLVHSMDD